MNIHTVFSAISPIFRRRRMQTFIACMHPTERTNILDVGGYPNTWVGTDISSPVTILNLRFSDEVRAVAGKFSLVEGDGTELPYADREYDVCFSNSVIEHLGSWENQQRFAQEVRRAGARVWVQTPARCFPIEPHLIAPVIHWLPKSWQRRLIRRFTLWGMIMRPSRSQVDAFLDEVKLLSFRQMHQLFPDCEIRKERFLGLTKSYVAVRQASA